MFEIQPDFTRSLIRVELTGFWSSATAQDYAAALGAAMQAFLARGRPFGLLIDGRAFPPQQAEVAERLGGLMTRFPAPEGSPLRGVAIVVGSMLNKLQAEHAFGRAVSVFVDPDAAAAWIDARLHDDVA